MFVGNAGSDRHFANFKEPGLSNDVDAIGIVLFSVRFARLYIHADKYHDTTTFPGMYDVLCQVFKRRNKNFAIESD